MAVRRARHRPLLRRRAGTSGNAAVGPRAPHPVRGRGPELRSIRAGAVWTGLPAREQHLLLWLLGADIVTAELASLLVYGQLRTAQRRLARLVELGLLRGFWSASAHRPRGRYAYVLTRATRIDVERLAWPHGRPDRPPDLPSSPPIHELATLDLFAAFLRHGDPMLREGIFTWVPERVCAQVFGGFLRPDALAGIRVGDRAIAVFIAEERRWSRSPPKDRPRENPGRPPSRLAARLAVHEEGIAKFVVHQPKNCVGTLEDQWLRADIKVNSISLSDKPRDYGCVRR